MHNLLQFPANAGYDERGRWHSPVQHPIRSYLIGAACWLGIPSTFWTALYFASHFFGGIL